MTLKKGWLITLSGALLISGSALLWSQLSPLLTFGNTAPQPVSARIQPVDNKAADLTAAAFSAENLKIITFQDDGQDRFELLLVNYKDREQHPRNALLFPKSKQESVLLPSSTGLRQNIWETAAETIRQKAPEDALFLSWWDDAQRLHFLTSRETWVSKPGSATFNSRFWQTLKSELARASDQDNERLTKLARWLTMDSEQALQEIRLTFGDTKPVYLVVNNDLLMRLPEMADYGGAPLALINKIVPASRNLHGDISGIKQLAQEEGEGNYLIQKEGAAYRLWLTPKQSAREKNTLLVRLLPFVESLKQLPTGIELVYQSHWGGYLSVYRLNPKNS